MKNTDDIESFLIDIEAEYTAVGENIWVIKDSGPEIVVSTSGPLLVFRVKVMEENSIEPANREALFRKLLELNASEMIHGAYGIEEGAIVMTSALELENLDFNEFQASMEDMSLAVSKHYPVLSRLAA